MENLINKIFLEDNLQLLKRLPDNSVNLIYCDILYGTGRQFKTYKDLKANKALIYEFYSERIKEMHRVLNITGSIYFQMDWRIEHWIRLMMEESFGWENFRNLIFWPREQSKGAKSKSRQFARNSDVILFYTKSDIYTWNGCFKEYDAEYIRKRFQPDADGRLFMDCPLGSYAKHPIEELEAKGRIYTTKTGGKRYKKFLDEMQGVAVGDIWDDIAPLNSMANENVQYDTQKPIELLERIIKVSSKEGDLVADFFLGSGATAIAAKKLKRNYLGCDISEVAIEKTEKRLSEV